MNYVDNCIYFVQDNYNKYIGHVDRAPFWPVLITAIIIFLAVSEIGSQDCDSGSCGHYKSKIKTNNDVDNVINQLRLNHTSIGWRRALILSMLLSLIIITLFYPGLPDGFDFFLVSTILFLIIYFTGSWFEWHWWNVKDNQIEDRLLELRHNINEIKLNRKDNYYESSVMRHISSILSSSESY